MLATPRRSGSTCRARGPARGGREPQRRGRCRPAPAAGRWAIIRSAVGPSLFRRRGVPALRLATAARRSSLRRVSSRDTPLGPAPHADGEHAPTAEQAQVRPRDKQRGLGSTEVLHSQDIAGPAHQEAHGASGQISVPSALEARRCASAAPTTCVGGNSQLFSPRHGNSGVPRFQMALSPIVQVLVNFPHCFNSKFAGN